MDEIILGDAYELIKKIPDKSVDLIVTDPPYLIEDIHESGILRNDTTVYYEEISEGGIDRGIDTAILDEFSRVMKVTNIYIWCNKEQIIGYLDYFVKGKGCNFEIIIWAKENPIPFCGTHYVKDKEYCLYFWETSAHVKIPYERGQSVYSTKTNKADKELYLHPTIKPEPIIENLILNSSKEGDVVFDPFSGSGTICAVAKRLGRHYLGFEIDPKWHKVSLDRLEGITQKESELGYVQQRLF